MLHIVGWHIWRKYGLAQICCWKREKYFTFSDNCGYLSRYHTKKSRPKIQTFLKRFIVIKRNAKPYQWFFCAVTLKSTNLPCTLISYPCMTLQHHSLVIWKISLPWVMLVFLMLMHLIMQYRKSTFTDNQHHPHQRRLYKPRSCRACCRGQSCTKL